jgi:ABC-2 type transport system permease protein
MSRIETIKPMARLYTRTIVRSRRTLFAGFFVTLPLLFFVIAAFTFEGDDFARLGLFSTFQFTGTLGMILPFAALFLGLAVVSEELDNGTMVYLLIRPFTRSGMLLGRALAASVLLFAALTVLNLLLLAVTRPASAMTAFMAAEFALLLGIVAYLAAFTLIAVLFRKPVAPALVYLIAWDMGISALDFSLRHASIRFNILNLYRSLVEIPIKYNSVMGKIWELCNAPALQSILILAGMVVVFWGVSVYRFNRFQL